ncbi:hypothetical protein F5Y03DRAFT_369278 [Xylaria venustula]|nr:hypothetical protein F5Y03DRAFT_369278 [Xylaria venustula]
MAQGFALRRPSAMPEPLNLLTKYHPRYGLKEEDERFRPYDSIEMPPQRPAPVLVTGPRPPTTPCRPSMYEDEDQDEDSIGNVGPGADRGTKRWSSAAPTSAATE